VTRTGVYRCPRCGVVRTALAQLRTGVIVIDERPQRLVCPVEGADMTPLSEADLSAFHGCAAEGHVVESWRGACGCGTVKA